MEQTKRRRVLANRAAKLARQRGKRRRAARNVWRHLTRDQQEVAQRLTKGQISLVTLSGWGFLIMLGTTTVNRDHVATAKAG